MAISNRSRRKLGRAKREAPPPEPVANVSNAAGEVHNGYMYATEEGQFFTFDINDTYAAGAFYIGSATINGPIPTSFPTCLVCGQVDEHHANCALANALYGVEPVTGPLIEGIIEVNNQWSSTSCPGAPSEFAVVGCQHDWGELDEESIRTCSLCGQQSVFIGTIGAEYGSSLPQQIAAATIATDQIAVSTITGSAVLTVTDTHAFNSALTLASNAELEHLSLETLRQLSSSLGWAWAGTPSRAELVDMIRETLEGAAEQTDTENIKVAFLTRNAGELKCEVRTGLGWVNSELGQNAHYIITSEDKVLKNRLGPLDIMSVPCLVRDFARSAISGNCMYCNQSESDHASGCPLKALQDFMAFPGTARPTETSRSYRFSSHPFDDFMDGVKQVLNLIPAKWWAIIFFCAFVGGALFSILTRN